MVESSRRPLTRSGTGPEAAYEILEDEHPGVRFYEFSDGTTTMAIEGAWVSAIFESLSAAKTWIGDSLEAERVFRANDRRPIGRRP